MRSVLAQPQRFGTILLAALVGLAALGLAGAAVARTSTLKVAKNAPVTDTTGMTSRGNIAVSSHGRAIYLLTGDSKRHPECTKAKGCFAIWRPLTVASARHLSKASGIHGKLGVWHRNGFTQVTLGGHPLYTFAGDVRKNAASGEGIRSFGGTWHVVTASSNGSSMTTRQPRAPVRVPRASPPPRVVPTAAQRRWSHATT
jgi:predicted lipoprotein with Yx(FWY)xxD motif